MAALLEVAVPHAALAAPAISLSPNSGQTGTAVAVTGSGFTASSLVTVTFNGSPAARAGTDPSGAFTAIFRVPAVTAGAYPVVATDASGLTGSAEFTVTGAAPLITLVPPSGPSGTSVNVSGSNFTASSRVTVTFNGVAVIDTSTDLIGAFGVSFTVPVVAFGTYAVVATDAGGLHATTLFGVRAPLPAVSLSPTFGLSGAQVTVTGTEFTPAATVNLTFNGVSVGLPAGVDVQGNFTSGFIVPSLTPGTYSVAATDSTGLMASRTFTIVPLPNVLVPGHPFDLIPARLFAPIVIATDPDTGVLYGLAGDPLHPNWQLIKFSGGSPQVLSELTAPTSLVLGGTVSISMFSDLVFAGGFGGADLLSVDTLGHTIALSATGGPQRPFAPTTGSFLAGLALSEHRLFVSSGFVGQSTAIYAVDPTGAASTFLAAASFIPGALAISPDGQTLYYAAFFSGDLVKVDVGTATEIGRVQIGLPLSFSRLAVDPATGDVYASGADFTALLAGGSALAPVGQIVRYQPATGLIQTFAEGLTANFDLTFGPCTESQSSSREHRGRLVHHDPGSHGDDWCLFVTTGLGVMKIHGFQPASDGDN